jgi:hypothetical protein
MNHMRGRIPFLSGRCLVVAVRDRVLLWVPVQIGFGTAFSHIFGQHLRVGLGKIHHDQSIQCITELIVHVNAQQLTAQFEILLEQRCR